jgi:hypothetical protein
LERQCPRPLVRGCTRLIVSKHRNQHQKRLFFLYVGKKNLVESQFFKLNLDW